MPHIGDPAPDFALPGTGDRTYRLSDYRGQPVVLVFYPGDSTPVCTLQLRAYSAGMDEFDDIGAQMLALSPQDVASHQEFACREDLKMPLLADTDKAVGEAYEILGPLGFYRRSVFVVDEAGIIRYAHRSLTSLDFVAGEELVDEVRRARASA
jgi:peroxiredoxin Q/BCP